MGKFLIIASVFLLIGAGCTGNSDRLNLNSSPDGNAIVEDNGDVQENGGSPTTSLTIIPQINPEEIEANTIESGVKHIDLVVTDTLFKPGSMAVETGQSVEINVVSVEGVHMFVIDDIDLKVKLEAEEVIRFTAPEKAGTYRYYSGVHNDDANGVFGLMHVKEL